jgi:hypothetical protein
LTGAGTVAVTASQLGNSIYAAANPQQRTIQIMKAPLAITASDLTEPQGVPLPPLTGYTITGFVGNDTQAASVTGNPVLAAVDPGHNNSPFQTGSTPPVGTYPISIMQGTLTRQCKLCLLSGNPYSGWKRGSGDNLAYCKHKWRIAGRWRCSFRRQNSNSGDSVLSAWWTGRTRPGVQPQAPPHEHQRSTSVSSACASHRSHGSVGMWFQPKLFGKLTVRPARPQHGHCHRGRWQSLPRA